MPKLTAEEKADRLRARMLEKSREYQLGTYSSRFVAPVFQKMIRAEDAAESPCYREVVRDGALVRVFRKVGQCVCVTCGLVGPWSGGLRAQGIQCGHFLSSRRASILFEESNVAPQCSYCNRNSGEQAKFRQWMISVRGLSEVERLERLKNSTRQFSREELVDMRIQYQDRLKSALDRMEQ